LGKVVLTFESQGSGKFVPQGHIGDEIELGAGKLGLLSTPYEGNRV
jgi:hypothetical protein